MDEKDYNQCILDVIVEHRHNVTFSNDKSYMGLYSNLNGTDYVDVISSEIYKMLNTYEHLTHVNIVWFNISIDNIQKQDIEDIDNVIQIAQTKFAIYKTILLQKIYKVIGKFHPHRHISFTTTEHYTDKIKFDSDVDNNQMRDILNHPNRKRKYILLITYNNDSDSDRMILEKIFTKGKQYEPNVTIVRRFKY